MFTFRNIIAVLLAALTIVVGATTFHLGDINVLANIMESDISNQPENKKRTVVLNSSMGADGEDIHIAFSSLKDTGGTVKLIGEFDIEKTVKLYSDMTLDATEAVINGKTEILLNGYQVDNISVLGGTWNLNGKSELAKISGCNSCTFDSLTVSGGGMFGFGSIFIYCTDDASVLNCSLDNISSEAVYAYKSARFTVQDCSISGAGGHGIRIYGSEDFRVVGNTVDGAYGDGISCSHCNVGEISGNVFKNITKNPDLDIDLHRNTSRSGCGILISESENINVGKRYTCNDITYEGNKVNNCENYGIHVTTSYDTFIHKTNFGDIGTDGVHNSASANTTVQNCIFKNCREIGISFIPGPLSNVKEDLLRCNNSFIYNNTIDICGNFGIMLSKAVLAKIQENSISNCRDYGIFCNNCEDVTVIDGKIKFTKSVNGSGIGINNCNNVVTDVKLQLDKTTLSLGKGESYTIKTENNAAEWVSSNTDVVSVLNGTVTALGVGTATVTAKTDTGKSAICKVTVKNEPEDVTISKKALSLGVGETYMLTAAIPEGTAAAVKTFRTSDSSVIKMTNTNWKGEFKAVSTGVAWVTVRLYNGKEASCKITVKKAPSFVSLSKQTVTLGAGENYKLNAVFAADEVSSVRTFSSDNSSIVSMTSINGTGEFRAVQAGTASVTVRTFNGKEASCKVIVKDAPDNVSLSADTVTLGVGETYRLTTSIPQNTAAASRVFRSSDSSIVKMTQTDWNGEFTAVKPGTAWVTVRLYNGVEASCKVIVKKAPTWVKTSSESLKLKVGQTASLTAVLPADCASLSPAVFSSSNSGIVAMTNKNGTAQFKAVKKGTAYVIVHLYNGKEARCKITVE